MCTAKHIVELCFSNNSEKRLRTTGHKKLSRYPKGFALPSILGTRYSAFRLHSPFMAFCIILLKFPQFSYFLCKFRYRYHIFDITETGICLKKKYRYLQAVVSIPFDTADLTTCRRSCVYILQKLTQAATSSLASLHCNSGHSMFKL